MGLTGAGEVEMEGGEAFGRTRGGAAFALPRGFAENGGDGRTGAIGVVDAIGGEVVVGALAAVTLTEAMGPRAAGGGAPTRLLRNGGGDDTGTGVSAGVGGSGSGGGGVSLLGLGSLGGLDGFVLPPSLTTPSEA